MIIKTSSIDYDERLKKEVKSILNIGKYHISIFAIEDQVSNFSEKSVNVFNPKFFFRGIKFRYLKIFTLLELLVRLKLKFKLNTFDKIWIHDPIMVFIIPFIRLIYKKEIIWDLHELPAEPAFKYKLLNKFFKYAASISNKIIVANDERGEFMIDEKMISSFTTINNYPSQNNTNIKEYKDTEFDSWIKNKEFAYCQSATHPSRNFDSLAQACVNTKQYLVVVGEKNRVYTKVRNKVANFDNYILVLGKKPSDFLSYYISRAKYSFIFYQGDTKNNYYCAPNRLYHSLKYGKPVIVGMNPPMKSVVEGYKCGVHTEDYGKSADYIEKAIIALLQDFSIYQNNAIESSKIFVWEEQGESFNKILGI